MDRKHKVSRKEKVLIKIISEMVECPAGCFVMGSPLDEWGRNCYNKDCEFESQHLVAITKPFQIAKYPVTIEFFSGITNNHLFRSCMEINDNHPVRDISYNEAKKFCRKLNSLLDKSVIAKRLIPENYHFDLPTEAQWEYACRAGTVAAFNNNKNLIERTDSEDYKTNIELQEIAWYNACQIPPWICDYQREHWMNWYEEDELPQRFQDVMKERWAFAIDPTNPVGQLAPNRWGIYDMHGNVKEWVRDRFDKPEDYSRENAIDPEGSKEGEWGVLRGGCFRLFEEHCRSAARCFSKYGESTNDFGFRLALVPKINMSNEYEVEIAKYEKEQFMKNSMNFHQQTFISALINDNPLQRIERLLKKVGTVNFMGEGEDYQETPLTAAASYISNYEVIELLLNSGASLDDRNKDNYNALQCAACHNSNILVMKSLLKAYEKSYSARYIYIDNDEDPIHLALWHNPNFEIIKTLIDKKVNQKANINYLNSLLAFVAEHRYCKSNSCFKEITEYLVKLGANPNASIENDKNDDCYSKREPALIKAIKYNSLEAVKTILELGGNPNLAFTVLSFRPITALTACFYREDRRERLEILKLLIGNNADVFQKGSGAPNLAALAAGNECANELDYIISIDKNIITFNDGLNSCVIKEAIRSKCNYDRGCDCLRILIDAGISREYLIDNKTPVLNYAFEEANIKAIKLLAESGFKLTNPDEIRRNIDSGKIGRYSHSENEKTELLFLLEKKCN